MKRRFGPLAIALFSMTACGDSDVVGGAAAGGAGTGGDLVTAGSGAGGAGAGGENVGGSPPPSCQLATEGCGPTEKCSLVDKTLGIPAGLGCVAAGDGVAFATCDSDVACAAGLFCDFSTSVCKPFCDIEGFACTGDAACVVGRDSAGTVIEGLHLCVADCDPQAFSVNPCGDDDGATCYFREDVQEFDCGSSGNLGWASSCDSSRECRSGLGCFANAGSAATMCLDWCSPVGSPAACFGTKANGSWFCSQFAPCGPCDAAGLAGPTGTPLGSCSWGQ